MKIPIHLSSPPIKNILLSSQVWPAATSGNKDGLETELHVLSTDTETLGAPGMSQLPSCLLGTIVTNESHWAGRRCTHWINFPSRESSFSSLCSLSSSLACFLRMLSLSSSRHLAFSIISCRFRSSSSDESFLLNTKTTPTCLLLS